MSSRGWIGVDLDGTLARYDGWRGPEHIGEPIMPMIERVKAWLEEGKDVRIFTARANFMGHSFKEALAQLVLIEKWCADHIGRVLPITYQKDHLMTVLYDDRCVPVEKNTGRLLTLSNDVGERKNAA